MTCHEDFMRQAVEAAVQGEGRVHPNPLVGAVIVKDGTVIGRGYHACCGGPHAERAALSACRVSPENSDLYVTLTPCCHHGRTPPCTDAIIAAGIRRVFIGSDDPNPLVGEKSIHLLEAAGITVHRHVLKEACDALNPVFFHYIKHRTPYVVLKYAMTADGKVATVTGQSRWITGPAAREQVHRDRNRLTAIMTGIGTVLADDPLLTCRLPGGRDPIRIICDSRLRIPLSSQIVQSAATVPTIIATVCADSEKADRLKAAGCQVLTVAASEGHLSLTDLMQQLGALEIDSILLEGGPTLNAAALKAGIVHRLQTYIAPKLFGGSQAPGPVGGPGVAVPDGAVRLSEPSIRRFGQDLLLESEVLPCSLE